MGGVIDEGGGCSTDRLGSRLSCLGIGTPRAPSPSGGNSYSRQSFIRMDINILHPHKLDDAQISEWTGGGGAVRAQLPGFVTSL